MAHRITAVQAGSIAEQCGLKPGDVLLSINKEPILDQIDYQFFCAQDRLILEVDTGDEIVEIDVEKDEPEPLGLSLDSTVVSKPRTCANHCVFCFIDQMPEGMRDTLYVKDDDWRLSLMMGNYITLTNLSDREFDRIIARKASPLYISIHATDGAVRARMMGNARAAGIHNQLKRLAAAGIAFHCQVVLCPGMNDGKVLDDTIHTLQGLYPAARTVALVPVGLTKFRQGLTAITPYDQALARTVLAQTHQWQQKLLPNLGTRFVFAADEFYCLAGAPVPSDDAYEGYPQIENGVGLLRSFAQSFEFAAQMADPEDSVPRSVVIVTGKSAAPFLRDLVAKHPVAGVDVQVLSVENTYFGPTVTVAGLLTGKDIIDALAEIRADEVLIPRVVLRHEGELFLDNTTLTHFKDSLSMPVRVVGCEGAELYDALQGNA